MKRSVSIVIPALDDRELLERHLPPLLAELERRAVEDEVLVVDDTGEDVLGPWLEQRFPDVRALPNATNLGFAGAMRAGFEAASSASVFAMNPDVLVRPGFLDPLVACLDDAEVQAVVPRVLLGGEKDAIESLVEVLFEAGEVRLRQPALEEREEGAPLPIQPVPVPFAIGGAALFRRAAFLARGGFDPAFEPFYWEDVDLGWSFWRGGGQVLYQPGSIVEHHHRGTIGRVVPRELVRAAIEKNRYLFQWKHLDEPALVEEHVAFLYRQAIDAWLGDRRDELSWLALALEQAQDVLAARRPSERGPGFGELLRRSAPLDRSRPD